MRTFKSRAETETKALELQVRATGLDIDEGCMRRASTWRMVAW